MQVRTRPGMRAPAPLGGGDGPGVPGGHALAGRSESIAGKELFFSLEEYRGRLASVRRHMAQRGIDALLVHTPEDILHPSMIDEPNVRLEPGMVFHVPLSVRVYGRCGASTSASASRSRWSSGACASRSTSVRAPGERSSCRSTSTPSIGSPSG